MIEKENMDGGPAVIQRALGGSSFGSGFEPVASPDAPSGAGTPIDVESTVVDEAPHPGASSGPAAGRGPAAATRLAASPPLFGSVPLTMPDGLSLTVPDSIPLTMTEVLPSLPGLPGAMPSPKVGETDLAVVPTGGRFVERSYTNQTGTRTYKLYIPSGYI